MDTRKADAYDHFLYDPQLLGISENFWKIRGPLSGSNASEIGYPACDDTSIILDEATLLTREAYAGGIFNYDLTIPADPSNGDSRQWGLKALGLNSSYQVVFDITDSTFSAKVTDENGNSNSQTISWDSSAWKGSSVDYTIEWRRNFVDFRINGRQVAHFARREDEAVPEFFPIPAFVANDNNDTVNLNEFQLDDVQMVQEGEVPAEKGEVLANVTAGNASDGTYYYYLDMHSYPFATLQFDWTAGAGSVTGTVEATNQDDGTKKENCSYQDITNEFFGTSSVSGSSIFSFDSPTTFKYIRLKLVVSSSDSNTAWQVYSKRQRNQ